jgi:hydroxymethylbilane synthase
LASTNTQPLVIGTRGSRLSLVQSQEVVSLLLAAFPTLEIEVRTIMTAGDRDKVTPVEAMGGKGIFVSAVEEALLDGSIDLAIHSAKDVPETLAAGLAIGAVTGRLDGADALVAARGVCSLGDLPPGTRVGTSAPRRRAMLLEMRPDLEIVPMRGNVDTRLAKLHAGECDATVLAAVGLMRLGREDEIICRFNETEFIPAAGQGALIVEVREGEHAEICAALDDERTHTEHLCERAFIAAVGGTCRSPIGVRAWCAGDSLRVRAMIAKADGSMPRRAEVTGQRTECMALAEALRGEFMQLDGEAIVATWGESS